MYWNARIIERWIEMEGNGKEWEGMEENGMK